MECTFFSSIDLSPRFAEPSYHAPNMATFLLWSDWKPLAHAKSPNAATLSEILDGGQAFRWNRTPEGVWQGVWSDCVARLRLSDQGNLQWSAPNAIADAVGPALESYFGAGTDFDAVIDRMPWRSDPHLANCIQTFPALRILHQPFGETLVHLLCSATKQSVQIKQMSELIALRHGKEIVAGFHRLPTWAELATVPEDALRACLLGFRARYIKATALFLAEHTGWLEDV